MARQAVGAPAGYGGAQQLAAQAGGAQPVNIQTDGKIKVPSGTKFDPYPQPGMPGGPIPYNGGFQPGGGGFQPGGGGYSPPSYPFPSQNQYGGQNPYQSGYQNSYQAQQQNQPSWGYQNQGYTPWGGGRQQQPQQFNPQQYRRW